MPDIDFVCTTLKCDGEHLERLRQMFLPASLEIVKPDDFDALTAALQHADVAIIRDVVSERFLTAPRLRWVHVDRAGLERSARPEVFARGLIVTGSAGRSAPAIAEHALLFMLALSYRLPSFLEAQRRRQWGIKNQSVLRGLTGKTVGILGAGHTAKELANRAKSCGMDVLGYRRRNTQPPAGFDHMFCRDSGDTLDSLLGDSDFVVVALPLNDRTHHLIGDHEFKLMRRGSCIVNVGRGAVIDEVALIQSLESGHLAGAGLDTFAVEPLPRSSPLWGMPNVILTPHTTPQVGDRMTQSLDILEQNVRRYRQGKALLNQLLPEDCYSAPIVPARSPASGMRPRLRPWIVRLDALRRRVAYLLRPRY